MCIAIAKSLLASSSWKVLTLLGYAALPAGSDEARLRETSWVKPHYLE